MKRSFSSAPHSTRPTPWFCPVWRRWIQCRASSSFSKRAQGIAPSGFCAYLSARPISRRLLAAERAGEIRDGVSRARIARSRRLPSIALYRCRRSPVGTTAKSGRVEPVLYDVGSKPHYVVTLLCSESQRRFLLRRSVSDQPRVLVVEEQIRYWDLNDLGHRTSSAIDSSHTSLPISSGRGRLSAKTTLCRLYDRPSTSKRLLADDRLVERAPPAEEVSGLGRPSDHQELVGRRQPVTTA